MNSSELSAVIHARLQTFFTTDFISVQDDSHLHAGHTAHETGGRHFSVTIISEKFHSLSRVARHQLVYSVLSDLMPHPLHALAIVAKTPTE